MVSRVVSRLPWRRGLQSAQGHPHYLEDGSTRVSEKRVENSGIVTGEIARRHRVPKKEGGYYTVEDFDVGTQIEIFGRAYHITDVDEFTREFYELNGMPRSEAICMPSDYLKPASRSLPATIHSYPDVMFQNQGVADRFLNLDRKVLRFYWLLWLPYLWSGLGDLLLRVQSRRAARVRDRNPHLPQELAR